MIRPRRADARTSARPAAAIAGGIAAAIAIGVASPPVRAADDEGSGQLRTASASSTTIHFAAAADPKTATVANSVSLDASSGPATFEIAATAAGPFGATATSNGIAAAIDQATGDVSVTGFAPGSTTFAFRVTAGAEPPATAALAVILIAAPIAVDDTIPGLYRQGADTVLYDVGANDTLDPNGDYELVNLNAVTGANGIGWAGTALGLHFPAWFAGPTGLITYQLQETNTGQLSNVATVSTAVLRAPDAVDDSAGPVTAAQAASAAGVVTDVIANDALSPNPAANYTIDQPTLTSGQGTVAVVEADGHQQVRYMAPVGFTGAVSYTYRLSDDAVTRDSQNDLITAPAPQSDTATVTLIVAAGPTASDGSVSMGQRPAAQPAQLSLAALVALDPIGGTPTYAVSATAGGAHTVQVDAAGMASIAPADGFAGTFAFDYTVTDELGHSATGTITVSVLGAPQIVAASFEATIAAGQMADLEFRIISDDPNVATAITTRPQQGDAQIADDRRLLFDSADADAGTYTAILTATDSYGQSTEATFTIHVIADAALAGDTGPDQAGGSGLAGTGAVVAPGMFGGAGAVLLGGMLLLIASRRRYPDGL